MKKVTNEDIEAQIFSLTHDNFGLVGMARGGRG